MTPPSPTPRPGNRQRIPLGDQSGPGGPYRVRRLITAVVVVCGVGLVTATAPGSAAAAAPATPAAPVAAPVDGGGGAEGAAVAVDNSRWPAALNWVIPGTAEFTARYLSGQTAGGDTVVTGSGCTAAQGGDAWAYTVDFISNLGVILDAQATATGQSLMTLGDQALPTAPWPGLATDRGIEVLTLGSGERVLAGPGALIEMPDSGAVLTAGGVGVCADTLRPYGAPAVDAPFGFGFYTAPDQGSVDFLMTQLAKQPAPRVEGQVWAVPAQFYDPVNGAENPLRAWDYSPLQVMEYCSDENNPFCLTAAFLRCPTGDGATDAEAAAITACRTWNANVIILNQRIAMTLLQPGVGVPADGGLDYAAAAGQPTGQAPLDGWTALAAAGETLTEAVTMFYVTMGAAVLVGGLVAGGIPGVLIAAGVIGAASLVASQGIFGAVTCAQDFPKCAAAAGADGLITTLGLIPDAARSARVPDMTGESMTRLLGTLGGISAAVVLVFFLISLLTAVLLHRPGQIWPAVLGVIGWGAALGLGGAFLTMLIAARGGVMTWLDTDGGGGTVLDGFPTLVQESLSAIAAGPTRGLLLAAVLSLVGMVLGAVVWVIMWVSGQWIPLVVALLVLQAAGLAAPGMPRKWLSRGFSVLWTLLLTPVMVMIIWRVGKIGLESNTGYLGLLGGVLILLGCAFSFLIVQRMLPMGEGNGLGVGAAMMTAASWVAGRASSAARPNPSRGQLAQQQLQHSTDHTNTGSDGAGSNGLDGTGPGGDGNDGDGGGMDGAADPGGGDDSGGGAPAAETAVAGPGSRAGAGGADGGWADGGNANDAGSWAGAPSAGSPSVGGDDDFMDRLVDDMLSETRSGRAFLRVTRAAGRLRKGGNASPGGAARTGGPSGGAVGPVGDAGEPDPGESPWEGSPVDRNPWGDEPAAGPPGWGTSGGQSRPEGSTAVGWAEPGHGDPDDAAPGGGGWGHPAPGQDPAAGDGGVRDA
jgi:hypothetical protein